MKIGQHEAAILMSGQSAVGAHARPTILLGELNAFSGRTEALIADVKSAGEVTRAQTMEEFKTFRGNMELWYSGIRAHVEKNGGGGKGTGRGSGDGKGSTRVDKRISQCGSFRKTSISCRSDTGPTRLASS